MKDKERKQAKSKPWWTNREIHIGYRFSLNIPLNFSNVKGLNIQIYKIYKPFLHFAKQNNLETERKCYMILLLYRILKVSQICKGILRSGILDIKKYY